MADPQHVATLDGLDVLTVRLYRTGVSVAALALIALGAVELWGLDGGARQAATWALGVGTAVAVADLHLYDKRIRWFEGVLGWAGLGLSWLGALVPGVAGHTIATAGLGFVFAAMSGIALKEQFCFRIPFLRLVPLILAPSLIPVLLHNDTIAGAMHVVGGALFALLAGAKAAQPLHFDIGDKRHYQI